MNVAIKNDKNHQDRRSCAILSRKKVRFERTRLLAKEQPHHLRAFEHYYGLGEQRSYERVATKFSVAASTVKLWARSFGWRDRIRERDLEIAWDVAGRR